MTKSDLKTALLFDCIILKRDKFTGEVVLIESREQVKGLTCRELTSVEVYRNITHNFRG